MVRRVATIPLTSPTRSIEIIGKYLTRCKDDIPIANYITLPKALRILQTAEAAFMHTLRSSPCLLALTHEAHPGMYFIHPVYFKKYAYRHWKQKVKKLTKDSAYITQS